jgi:hypothetical protein
MKKMKLTPLVNPKLPMSIAWLNLNHMHNNMVKLKVQMFQIYKDGL